MVKSPKWVELTDWQIMVIEKSIDNFVPADPSSLEFLKEIIKRTKRIKVCFEKRVIDTT